MILGGILLVLLEIFVMPGFGIPGILGLVMLFGGLIGTFAGVGQLFPGFGGDGSSPLAWAASVVLMAMFIAGVGIFFFIRYTDKFPVAGRLVLADRAIVPGDEAEESMISAMSADAPSHGPVAVGALGTTITPLRPAGSVEFGDKLVDVVSEFGFVEAGVRVRAVSVSEYRVVVELIKDPPTMPGSPGSAGSPEAKA
jgi:membrane-bound serine protease (ClpP class)